MTQTNAQGATPARYGPVAQLLHWSMFALIALQWLGGKVMGKLPKSGSLRGIAFDTHETLGLLLLLLVFVRISWRMAHPAPRIDGPRWQQAAARVAHLALYLLLIALPVAGYLSLSASGYDTAFFGWQIPAALEKDAALQQRLSGVHQVLAFALLAVVVLHVAAALWHHVVARDATLRRMLPVRRTGAATVPAET
ncbi:MAG: cytochrome b [Burkholderiales bacterium]|nr:cytochrome b [Burkholderiales bacterium]